MKKLLAADFYRMFKDKFTRAIFIIFGILSIIIPFWAIVIDHETYYSYNKSLGIHTFTATGMFTFAINFFPLIVTLFASIMIFKDYSSGNVRNKILGGFNRKTIFLASAIEHLIISFVISSAAILTTSIISSAFLPFSRESVNFGLMTGRIIVLIIVNIACTIFTSALCTMFTYGCKNLALGILCMLILVYAGYTLVEVCQIAVSISDYEEGMYIFPKFLECVNFYLGKMLYLLPNKDYSISIFETVAGINDEVYYSSFDVYHIIGYIIVPLGFSALFTFLGMKAFEKRDLK